MIHASAAVLHDEAVVFLGPATTGKSTICCLLSPHMQTVADDLVCLVPRMGGGWSVVDAGNSTTIISKEVPTDRTYPLLRCVFRLRQAESSYLEPLDSLETCRCLTDAFFEVRWQRLYDIETKKAAFVELAMVARSVPGYVVHFSLSPDVFMAVSAILGADK